MLGRHQLSWFIIIERKKSKMACRKGKLVLIILESLLVDRFRS